MTEHQLIGTIVGVAIALISALIGILYKIHSGDIQANKDSIKALDEKTDNRLDNVEKDIIRLENKN
jgi:hypothetical protein